jgi:hypothetical protein
MYVIIGFRGWCSVQNFGCEPRQILGTVQCFGKHRSCHRQVALLLHQSAPSHPTFCLLPGVHKRTRIDQKIYVHCEDGNCSVCRNIGQLAINTTYTKKPTFYIVGMDESLNKLNDQLCYSVKIRQFTLYIYLCIA